MDDKVSADQADSREDVQALMAWLLATWNGEDPPPPTLSRDGITKHDAKLLADMIVQAVRHNVDDAVTALTVEAEIIAALSVIGIKEAI